MQWDHARQGSQFSSTWDTNATVKLWLNKQSAYEMMKYDKKYVSVEGALYFSFFNRSMFLSFTKYALNNILWTP